MKANQRLLGILASLETQSHAVRQMKMKRRYMLIGMSLALAVLLLLPLVRCLLVDYPTDWMAVQPGLPASHVSKLMGTPWADGDGLKSLDRYRTTISGVTMHMDVWYEFDQRDNVPVSRVGAWREYLWAKVSRPVLVAEQSPACDRLKAPPEE